MRGPVAPKNPEKKRAGFYIMREKEVFGAPQEDGSGVQFLYESDGRLVNQDCGKYTGRRNAELFKKCRRISESGA